MTKRRLNTGLLFATLGGLAASIIAMVPELTGADLAWGIAGAVGAAIAALFIDRDGDGVPPIVDEDQR